MSRRIWVSGAVLSGVVVAVVIWRSGSDTSNQTLQPAAPSVVAVPASGLAASGIFRLDSAGHLITDQRLRSYLDARFPAQALAHWSPAQWSTAQQAVLIEIQSLLHGQAAIQATQLLSAYVSLRQALVAQHLDQPAEQFTVQEASRQLASIQALRQHYLPESVNQDFYAQQDEHDHYLLSQSDIMQNPALSNAEKLAAIQKLQSSLHTASRRAY